MNVDGKEGRIMAQRGGGAEGGGVYKKSEVISVRGKMDRGYRFLL